MWTRFWDMHSGGSQKEKQSKIYIEAPEKEAKIIFYNRFGHNPDRVTCTCCGEDYVVDEYETLEKATEYFRRSNSWHNLEIIEISLKDYIEHGDCLVIYEKDISPNERKGNLPLQGYIWV